MSEPFDSRAFRQALGQFATGVTIVTTLEPNGTPRGFTANSFTSVSLDPPLLLVCIANSAASRAVFCEAPRFSINILSEEQKETSGLFATQRPDKFDIAPWRVGQGGVPLIDGALAWFECTHHDAVPAGDHVILIGRVTDFGYREAQPLGYLRGGYFTLGLEDTLVDVAGRGAGTVVGAVLEQDRQVLLMQDPATGALSIPTVGDGRGPASLERLRESVAGSGLSLSIDFVYAVVESRGGGVTSIYYRGRASGAAPPGMLYYPLAEIPWERIANPAGRTMLQRYAKEATEGSFAIYMGDEVDGVVQAVG